MRIILFVKQVPDTNEIQIERGTNRLIREGVPSILNPFDTFALETALRLKEKHGGTITAVTMGPQQATAVLKQCVSLGADNAYIINDPRAAGSDTYGTSYILSAAVNYLEKLSGKFDLLICGKQAMDGDTAQVGPALAEHLNLPQITGVTDLPVIENGIITARSEKEDRYDFISARLPVLITIGKTDYELRYASILGIIASNKFDYANIRLDDLNLDTSSIGLKGSPTVTKKKFVPELKDRVIMIDGRTDSEKAANLAAIIKKHRIAQGG